jgi:hypothetical protein
MSVQPSAGPAASESSFTVDQFCLLEGISRATYFKLRREGRGPREMIISGNIIRITVRSRADWQRARERESRTSAAIKAKRKSRSVKNKASGSIAAASPRHHCRRTKPEA